MHKLSYVLSGSNVIAAIVVIGYWAINEIRITQHFVEVREIVVLVFELLVAVSGVYLIFSHPSYSCLKIFQYVVFGIHFTTLIAGLIFMLTFKMKRLL